MSNMIHGSLAGLAGSVGNLQNGQGLAEYSRYLTRGGAAAEQKPTSHAMPYTPFPSLGMNLAFSGSAAQSNPTDGIREDAIAHTVEDATTFWLNGGTMHAKPNGYMH